MHVKFYHLKHNTLKVDLIFITLCSLRTSRKESKEDCGTGTNRMYQEEKRGETNHIHSDTHCPTHSRLNSPLPRKGLTRCPHGPETLKWVRGVRPDPYSHLSSQGKCILGFYSLDPSGNLLCGLLESEVYPFHFGQLFTERGLVFRSVGGPLSCPPHTTSPLTFRTRW